MVDGFDVILRGRRFRSVDLNRCTLKGISLAAFDNLQPPVVGHVGHGDPLRRIGIQHGEEQPP